LVVISIITILAGMTLVFFNPVEQRRKANEAVVRTNTAKLCMALESCNSLKDSASDCDSADELGVQVQAGYSITTPSANVVQVSGTVDTCTFSCSIDFSTGVVTNLSGVGCL